MKAYKNLSGNSGIIGYEIYTNAIDIEFASGKVYTYTKENLGEVNFEVMKAHCEAGAGLCGFIHKVRNAYTASKPTLAEINAAIINVSNMIEAYRS